MKIYYLLSTISHLQLVKEHAPDPIKYVQTVHTAFTLQQLVLLYVSDCR